MKLLPKNLKNKLPSIEEAKQKEDPILYVKYFHPMSSWTWFAAGYSDDHFWGLVDGDFLEIGIFCLSEMKSIRLFELGIERDLHFNPKPMSEIRQEIMDRRR